VLWQAKEPQHASRWFDRALLSLTGRQVGATLQLLAACAGTIAYCCFDDQHFRTEATAAIAKAEPKLPAAAAIIQRLQVALQRPDTARVKELLAMLRFHYH